MSWEFNILNEQDITIPAKEGVYIKNIILEGARYDLNTNSLVEPYPMQLYTIMPIIHFKPVYNKKNEENNYKIPLYLYGNRAGSLDRPSLLMEIDISAGQYDANFWIKRGAALLLT